MFLCPECLTGNTLYDSQSALAVLPNRYRVSSSPDANSYALPPSEHINDDRLRARVLATNEAL